jgi:predicted nucleic acid-binding protein
MPRSPLSGPRRHLIPHPAPSESENPADPSPNRDMLDRLPVDSDSQIAVASLGQRILRLGIEHGLSAYDASYLELAMRRGLPLATQDERLLRAAGAAGIEILEP